MNNIFRFLTTAFSILFFLGFNMSNTNAQCSIVGINASSTIVTINISCDFPVFINTGNAEADDSAYTAEKNNWIANHQADYDAIMSLTDSHYEIHQDDLNAMSAAKQAAILASPERYHIIP